MTSSTPDDDTSRAPSISTGGTCTSLTQVGNVWVLEMQGSETQPGVFENRFNPAFIAELNSRLDEVEAAEGTCALVTTSSGKIYSNGLDLEWLGEHPKEADAFMASVHKLLHRLLFFPVPTVAALNGHAFAGGCMLALAHDYRVMREDRGYLCLNEIELGMNLTPAMNALVLAKVDRHVLREVLLQGRRFPAAAALEARMIDQKTAMDNVKSAAIALADEFASKGDNRKVYKKMKLMLYQYAHIMLTDGSTPKGKSKNASTKKPKQKVIKQRLTPYQHPRSRL